MRLKLFFLILFGFLLQVVDAALRDPQEYFFQETFGDYKEELSIARDEGKKAILIFFEMDECPFCHRMKTTVLNHSDVQDYFRKHFKIFSLDIEGDIEMVDFDGNTVKQKDFAFKQHRVRATPVIAFFDLEGKQIMRYTGSTGSKEEFVLLGRFIAEGHFKTTKFNRFKRDQSK